MASLLEQARAIQDEIVRLRRAIHRHPELGFREFETARLAAETLQQLGLAVRTGIGGTGVVGILGQGRPCIAIRADMDALPIQELNDVPYRSAVPGVMHACGHDGHVAMSLGAAMLLAGTDLPGQVRFLLQPSEEKPDDDFVAGAARMIADGAMEGVDAVIALHVDPGLPTGTIRIGAGVNGANEDSFWAAIHGRGCHGAYPESGLDPVFLAGQAILAVHGVVSRRVSPLDPAVISICMVRAGDERNTNVIPAEVRLAGTIRSLDEDVREQLHAGLRQALDVVKAWGGDYTLAIREACPATSNEAGMSDLIRQVAVELLGVERVLPGGLGMGAEDFGFMARLAPGAMFNLGVSSEGRDHPVHSPHFDIDEAALPLGAGLLAAIAQRWLDSIPR